MPVAFSHQTRALASVSPEAVLRRFETAHRKRRAWEDLWQDCYDYALPQRGDFLGGVQSGNRRSERLYDATALDAVDQLAAS
ncbi:MAG: phage tail protein, partial [Alphaproteobacteria bacterium]|nr:phage tail protein [Alphaproteobacteria bacterium]